MHPNGHAAGPAHTEKANHIMTFSSTHPALARALAKRGYDAATSVQTAVLEADYAGRDLLVSAQTGSGKTVAFGMAIAPTLLPAGEERFGPAGAPLALIIAPTRELALQVQRELAWLFADTGARVATCVGGMDVRGEARALAAGAHIVVGTPGRLRDHLERKRLDLGQLKSIVLDEADEMLDLGFRDDLEFILELTPPERQTLLFSATMPREIENLARRYQRNAARIQTVRRDEQHADIEYSALRVAPHDVENAVVNVLRFQESRATLVFCATREAVKRMHARLVERGFNAVALSGELSQSERNQALQALRHGRARVLVATDVAARGLDLPDLALVIHADLPNDGETLVHRSGRTGRAGKKGLCVMIVPHNRRRKAETLINAARLKVTWQPAPTAAEIRACDQERFLSDEIFTEPATPEELELVRPLLEARNPEEIAVALLRMHSAGLPAPQDLAADTGGFRRDGLRDDRGREGRPAFGRDRGERERPSFRGNDTRPERKPREYAGGGRHQADDNADMVWFRLNIGREKNADPRWLLPLICKAGDVSKAEIGAIRIFDRDTRFQIKSDAVEQFEHAVRLNPEKEGTISRLGSADEANEAPREEPKRKPHLKHEDRGPRPSTYAKPDYVKPDYVKSGRAERPSRPEKPAATERPSTTEKPYRAERPASSERSAGTEKSAGGDKSWRPKGPRRDDAAPPRTAAARPHRKGPRPPHSAARDHAPRSGDAPAARPGSKYAHKKKWREDQSSKS